MLLQQRYIQSDMLTLSFTVSYTQAFGKFVQHTDIRLRKHMRKAVHKTEPLYVKRRAASKRILSKIIRKHLAEFTGVVLDFDSRPMQEFIKVKQGISASYQLLSQTDPDHRATEQD